MQNPLLKLPPRSENLAITGVALKHSAAQSGSMVLAFRTTAQLHEVYQAMQEPHPAPLTTD